MLYLIAKSIPALATVIIDSKWMCGDTRGLGQSLQSTGEEIIATGVVDDMFIMSFWASKTTREWTLVLTDNENKDLSCVVTSGSKLKTISSSGATI